MATRIPLYLTDRQYSDLIECLKDAREAIRARNMPTAFECSALARVAGIERELWEQVIVVKAGD